MNRNDVIPLYLLRFICASMIVLHHTAQYFFSYYPHGYALDIAVDFFFVLSGFMMYYIYPTLQDKASFVLQRLFKLYPLNFLLSISHMALFGIKCTIGIIIANLFCIQSFFLSSNYYFSLNGVSWCVCVELFFYICYAIGYKHIFKSLILFIFINLFLYIIVYKYNIPYTAKSPQDVTMAGLIRFFPPARAFEFFAGCCTAYFLKYKKEPQSSFLSNIFCILGISLILFAGKHLSLPLSSLQYSFTIQYYKVFLICLGIFLCCYNCSFLPAKLSKILGSISFALFLVHPIINGLFIRYKLFSAFDNTYRFAIYIFITMTTSFLLFYLLEQPIYRFLKKHLISIKTFFSKMIINNIKMNLFLIFISFCLGLNLFSQYHIYLYFNADYTPKKESYITVHYTENPQDKFSEKNLSYISDLKTHKVFHDITLNAKEMHKLSFGFINFENVTINDLIVIGKDIIQVPFNNLDISTGSLNSHDKSSFSYLPNSSHGYVVFKDFPPIRAKYVFSISYVINSLLLSLILMLIYAFFILACKKTFLLWKRGYIVYRFIRPGMS